MSLFRGSLFNGRYDPAPQSPLWADDYRYLAAALDSKIARGLDPAVYGQSVHWTLPSGGTMKVSIAGCDTPEEAREKAWKMADEAGWTEPRWWQWWRWSDTKRA